MNRAPAQPVLTQHTSYPPTFLIYPLRDIGVGFFGFVLSHLIGLAFVIYFYSDLLLRTFDLVALVVAGDRS